MSEDPRSLQRIVARLAVDSAEMARRSERQMAAWQGAAYVPIICNGEVPAAIKEALPPAANLYDEWHSHAKTLLNGLHGVAGAVYGGSDAVPSVRANMGVGVLATFFGLKQQVFPDKMPWITEHISLDAALDYDAEQSPFSADIRIALERSAFLAEVFAGSGITPFCFDTQGPFDLAHLAIGDEIFLALYDEAEKVHRLLNLCTRLIIRVTRSYKEAVGEPLTGGRHSNGLAMRGGVRICEDTSTLLNAEQIAEFVVPYTRRVLQAFGGGWVHYCGKNDHLCAAVLAMPEAHGLNFGNPERHDLPAIIDVCRQRGKRLLNSPARGREEKLPDYFRRCLDYTSGTGQGLFLLWPEIRPDENAAAAAELWRAMQRQDS